MYFSELSNTRYLMKAYECKDPIERMKNICVYLLSGIHQSVYYSKSKPPFNSVIGETYQAKNSDGCLLFMEQTLHHPPTLNYDMIAPGKKFEMMGFGAISAHLDGLNTIRGWKDGKNILKMDDGSLYVWNNFKTRISGIIMGDRTYNFYDDLVIKDYKNKIECTVTLQDEIKEGVLSKVFSKKKEVQYDEGKIVIKKLNPKTKEKEIVATGYGSWIGQVYFGDKCYWSVLDKQQLWEREGLNIIPSDGRLREDLNAVLKGDMITAQKEKERIEEVQRTDQKLRDEYKAKLEKK